MNNIIEDEVPCLADGLEIEDFKVPYGKVYENNFFINNNYSTEPLIFICAKNKNYYMIKFLLKNGVNVNLKFRNEYLLTLLIKNGCCTNFIMNIIKNHNANINIVDCENNHLLFLVLKNQQYHNILYYIIYYRSIANNTPEADSSSACLWNNIDLNIIDKNGNPLILNILESGYTEIPLHMINLGCDVNMYTQIGDPLIFKLIKEKRFNAVNLLLSTRKVNIYSKNKYTNVSLFELLVNENLYTFIKYILETYNFIIPYKIIGNYSLIEIAAKNNNNLILNKLILYECAKKIQKIFRGYQSRKLK
jgi:hypothetical protein